MRPTPLNDQVAGPLKFLGQVRDSVTFMRYANPPGCHGDYLVSALTSLDKRYPPKKGHRRQVGTLFANEAAPVGRYPPDVGVVCRWWRSFPWLGRHMLPMAQKD